MKKMIIAVLLAASLLATTLTGLAGTSLQGYFSTFNIPESVNLDVPADIKVKKASATEYVDGPVIVKKTSSAAFPTFDFRATMFMDTVRNAFSNYMLLARTLIGTDTALLEELDATPVYGGFTVTIIYPKTVSLPDSILVSGELAGFNDATSNIFKEISRTVTTESSWSTMVIQIAVKSPDGTLDYVTAKQLEDNLDTYLADLTLTCEGAKPTTTGSKTIRGAVTGYTYIGGNAAGENKLSSLIYNAKQMEIADVEDETLSATIKVTVEDSGSSSGGGGGGGGGGTTVVVPVGEEEVTVGFEVGGDTTVIPPITHTKGDKISIDDITPPSRDGYAFSGWYLDPERTIKAPADMVPTKDTVLYAGWINKSVPDGFQTEGHIAYVIGYPEGNVKPESPITREEIATLFYRLLKEDARLSIYTATPTFSDVAADRWSAPAIATMANGGYILGYPDGTFVPSKPITRAEFITLATRFKEDVPPTNVGFYDAAGHWAEDAIIKGVSLSWINGYEDGTFRPDNNITRAEAMTIINNMLVRHVDAAGIHADTKQWPDNLSTSWYYYDVLEATNSHAFTRAGDGYTEVWTEVLDNALANSRYGIQTN